MECKLTRIFTVIHTLAGIEYERVCKGYAEASQLCATFVKAGIYPKIEIKYIKEEK